MKKYLLKTAHALRTRSSWPGLPLVYTGVVLLACFYALGLTVRNVFLLLPLACIIAGAVGFVRNEKRNGKY